MKALLDTHAFLWWMTDDRRLSSLAREVIGSPETELFFSAASAMELAIKVKAGKLQVPESVPQYVKSRMALHSIQGLPVTVDHALHVYTLPDHHRDPFDRILIAQSQLERLPILTADRGIARYAVEVIW